jgi:hypothetical protein
MTFNPRFGLEYAPTSFTIRFGKRELFVCRDFRKRYYSVNPVLECGAGLEPGHLEVLLLRRWLLIFSRAR